MILQCVRNEPRVQGALSQSIFLLVTLHLTQKPFPPFSSPTSKLSNPPEIEEYPVIIDGRDFCARGDALYIGESRRKVVEEEENMETRDNQRGP